MSLAATTAGSANKQNGEYVELEYDDCPFPRLDIWRCCHAGTGAKEKGPKIACLGFHPPGERHVWHYNCLPTGHRVNPKSK